VGARRPHRLSSRPEKEEPAVARTFRRGSPPSRPRAKSRAEAVLTRPLLAANGAPMSRGTAESYYEARRYARASSQAPLVRGSSWRRRCVVDPAKPRRRPEHGVTAFAGGDLWSLSSWRRATSTTRCPPAQAIDARLGVGPSPASTSEPPLRRQDDDSSVATTYYTKEVRDDRVLFVARCPPASSLRYTRGRPFVTPPSRAEEMYQPSVGPHCHGPSRPKTPEAECASIPPAA
jgi:hypothetical protein